MSVGSPICGLPGVYRPRILRPITYIHLDFFRVGYTMWWTVHSSNSRKRFRQRIVPTYPGAAYWLPQPELGERGGIFGHIYLAAAARMHNAVCFELVTAHGHLQRAGDQLGAHVIGHRIADHRLVEAVDHRRQMQPALPRLDVVSPTSWPRASARQ